MSPPKSHSALDELLSDIALPHDGASCFFDTELEPGRDADEGYSHAADPHWRAGLWLPAPQPISADKCAVGQCYSRTGERNNQGWPFIGTAATGDALGSMCCPSAKSQGVKIRHDRGHLRPTPSSAAADRGHLRAAAASEQSSAHSKKPRAAWRPCYQSIMKVSSSVGTPGCLTL